MDKTYRLYPDEDGTFTITESVDDIGLRIVGRPEIPITEEEVKNILDKGKEEFKFDHSLGRLRKKTKAEKNKDKHDL